MGYTYYHLLKIKKREYRNCIETNLILSFLVSHLYLQDKYIIFLYCKNVLKKKESPKEFATVLTASAQIYNSKVQKKQTLAGNLETAKANVDNVQNVLETILSAMPSWNDNESGDLVKVENLLTKANTLNTSVATALSKLKTADESLNVNQTNLNVFHTEHPELNMERLEVLNVYTSNDISRENESQKTAREAVVAKKTLFDNAEKLIAEHQTKKPELTEDDTLDSLNERIEVIEKQLVEIGEKKGAINQELKTDKENKERLGALIKEVDEKKAVYQKWSRLNQLIGNSTGCRVRMYWNKNCIFLPIF